MKYKIAICDDSDADRQYVLNMVDRWAVSAGHVVHTDTFTSAENFLFHYAEESDYDILLLDIEMGKMDGVTMAKQLRKNGSRAEIIFITSHFEFYGEGYEVDALHYLIKPISSDKLVQVLTKAAERLAVEAPSIVISCDGETVKLYEGDIIYVESFLHYIVIYTKNKEYKIKESISAFADKLSEDFYRIHRSYIASLKHITRISRTSVNIGKTELPLARGKYDDVNHAFIKRN